jgi:hypothetical protein
MYEITTAIKTLATAETLADAMAIAEKAAETFRYVEVKRIITTAPWCTESVKILTRGGLQLTKKKC